MASSLKPFDERSAIRRMSELINNLSIDERRILARLLNNWQNKDQRRHPRTPCSIITEYMVDNQVHKDLIKNISLGGAFIESQYAIPLNLVISQSFFFPNFEVPIRSNSKIVWTAPNGFGVQFEILRNHKPSNI
jgi:hypothetical protein